MRLLLNRSMEYISTGALRVGIVEHYLPSVCLLVHEQLPKVAVGGALLRFFDECCRLDVSPACELARYDHKRLSLQHYWDEYLQFEDVRKDILTSNKEDCLLYQQALR